MIRSKRHMFEIMESLEMTPVQGMLLMLFETGKGQSMQNLSCRMGCDASNVTGLVDRLDSQGLIECTVDPTDRRVKLIQLSDKGIKCRQEVLKKLRVAEAIDLERLTTDEREMFIRIVNKLTCDKAE